LPFKAILVAVVAMFFTLALGFLRDSINDAETELDRLYEAIAVNVDVRQYHPEMMPEGMRIWIGNVIGPNVVRGILNSGLTRHEYLEAGHEWAMIIGEMEDGSFSENWKEITGFDRWLPIWRNLDSMNFLFAFNDMDRFLVENSLTPLHTVGSVFFNDATVMTDDMHIEFAEGFDEDSFVFLENSPIPVILSEVTMRLRDLEPGDTAWLNHTPREGSPWVQTPIVVVGTHNRNIMRDRMRDAVIIPIDAMKYLVGEQIGYITFNFEINPGRAGELSVVREELNELIERTRWVQLRIDIQDEELRIVAGSMEQNLSLLRLLYPIAVTSSILIGLGVSLLIVLQNAKNAALLRSLGVPKSRTQTVLWLEQLLVCLGGQIIGLAVLLVLGWELSFAMAGLYFAGIFAGAMTGAVLVTNRSVIELLQAKE